jgi:hypothetical protein
MAFLNVSKVPTRSSFFQAKSSARHGKSLQGDRDMSIGGFLLPKFNGCQCSLVRRFAPYSYRWYILGRASVTKQFDRHGWSRQ